MKLNWGHGVAIALAVYMIFILTLLFTSGDTGSLVTENYYEKELTFQDEINAENNANQLKEKPQLFFQANGILIQFPEKMNTQNFKGEIYLLRNDDEHKDFKSNIKLDTRNRFLIPANKLHEGVYELSLSWQKDNKDYIIKKSVRWALQ